MSKDYNVLDELTPKTVELHREIFNRGYKQGFKDGKEADCDCKDNMENEYNRGFNEGLFEAWECVKRIYDLQCDTVKEIFGSKYFKDVLENYSASEAIKKVEEYEEKQKQVDEIKVGDEVTERGWSYKGIVTRANEVCCYVMWRDGSSGRRDTDDLHKTGKHIDGLDEILKQLQEVSE